jgi:ABC-type antimicrobial peptide transport system permease subunit
MRYAFRSCRKNAGFSAAVILIVSLAIGGSATVFSILNAALLRPLPYRDSDRVVITWEKRPKEGSRENGVTPADYLDWRARNRVFASLTAPASPIAYATASVVLFLAAMMAAAAPAWRAARVDPMIALREE